MRNIIIGIIVTIMVFTMAGCKDEGYSNERPKDDTLYEEIRVEEILVEEIHVEEISWEGDNVKRWD